MNPRSNFTFKLLMQRSGGESLLSFLPPEEAAEIRSLPYHDADIASLYDCHEISHFHSSWIDEALKEWAPSLQKHIFNSLKAPSGRFWDPFFLNLFMKKIQPPEILPLIFLPQAPLLLLLGLDHKQLINTISLLGVLDIARELRHIIDKETIKKTLSLLSSEQKNFLKATIKNTPHKSLQTSHRIIQEASNYAHMQKLLHQRGLIKISIALSAENQSFSWHVCHILDTVRGNFILKNSAKKKPSRTSKMLSEEVLLATRGIV
jgi:hypothetical protein